MHFDYSRNWQWRGHSAISTIVESGKKRVGKKINKTPLYMVATKKFRNSVLRNLAPNSAPFGGFCGKFRIILGFFGEIPYHFGALPKIPRHFGDLAAEFRLRNDNCKPPRVKRYFWRLKL